MHRETPSAEPDLPRAAALRRILADWLPATTRPRSEAAALKAVIDNALKIGTPEAVERVLDQLVSAAVIEHRGSLVCNIGEIAQDGLDAIREASGGREDLDPAIALVVHRVMLFSDAVEALRRAIDLPPGRTLVAGDSPTSVVVRGDTDEVVFEYDSVSAREARDVASAVRTVQAASPETKARLMARIDRWPGSSL